MKTEVIYQELNQTTNAEIEFVCSHRGGYQLTTDLNLKGQGIKQTGDGSDHKRNKKTFHVTENALNKLKQKHSTAFKASL